MRITQAEYDWLVKKGHLPMESHKEARARGGYKSKAEHQYAWELKDAKERGEIEWWAYEPFSLVIVDAGDKRCWYKPDFLVVRKHGTGAYAFEFIEVKGFLREAARLRFLAARERYPFFAFRMVRKKGNVFETIL